MIINVTGGPDLSLIEVSEASSIIQQAAHEEANIIFGAVIDDSLQGRVKITVIATGFDRAGSSRSPAASPSQTPVDLHDYTTRLRAPAQTIDVAATSRAGFARRPSLDLPATMAAGAEDQARARRGGEPARRAGLPAAPVGVAHLRARRPRIQPVHPRAGAPAPQHEHEHDRPVRGPGAALLAWNRRRRFDTGHRLQDEISDAILRRGVGDRPQQRKAAALAVDGVLPRGKRDVPRAAAPALPDAEAYELEPSRAPVGEVQLGVRQLPRGLPFSLGVILTTMSGLRNGRVRTGTAPRPDARVPGALVRGRQGKASAAALPLPVPANS